MLALGLKVRNLKHLQTVLTFFKKGLKTKFFDILEIKKVVRRESTILSITNLHHHENGGLKLVVG